MPPSKLEEAIAELEAQRKILEDAILFMKRTDGYLNGNRSGAELLRTAPIGTSPEGKPNPAAILGALGGKVTAGRGPEYFARIAAMRKNRKGGRPKKVDAAGSRERREARRS